LHDDDVGEEEEGINRWRGQKLVDVERQVG
jgi:hypothetical protein